MNQSDTVQDKAAGEGAGEEKTIMVFACKSWKSKITQCLRLESLSFFLLTLFKSEKGLRTEHFPFFL